jgi:FkbM family methyltransferase
MYSQREEEKFILEYFGNEGTFLDIGAYHPETFSNTRALFDRGWSGVCVEPSPNCYPTLRDFYNGTDVEVYNCAIGNGTGVIEFFDSNGDALSSTDKDHVKLWEKNYGSIFSKITVQCFTLSDLIDRSFYKDFDFVSIDVENDRLGIDILKQLDLERVKMICLECSYQHREEVKQITGWNEIYSNAENILMIK